MGELVDAIKAVAELGKDSVKVQLELESFKQKLKELEDKKSDEALKLQREEVRLSAAKFLFVVIGATLVMLLAGDHVVGLLRPKVPTLAQRIETFSKHDSNAAAKYLSECSKVLESLQKRLAPDADVPSQGSPPQQDKQAKSGDKQEKSSSSASEPRKISPLDVTKLRTACSEIVGE